MTFRPWLVVYVWFPAATSAAMAGVELRAAWNRLYCVTNCASYR